MLKSLFSSAVKKCDKNHKHILLLDLHAGIGGVHRALVRKEYPALALIMGFTSTLLIVMFTLSSRAGSLLDVFVVSC